MLDRESTFAHPEIVKLLKSEFVPVALDQAYQRRQQDTEGEFYRKIASQGPRNNFQSTTQGFYIAEPDGTLLLYNNNRDPEKVARLIREKLAGFKASQAATKVVEAIEPKHVDPKYNPQPPAGGIVVRVRAKVLDGYRPPESRWETIFQNAVSRDNLWITKAEHAALVEGKLPESLKTRMARFHLVDNTRGEPPMWKIDEVRRLELVLKEGNLSGYVHLETTDAGRGYQANILGKIETHEGKVTRFDVVALGDFWGQGTYTRGAPEGKFPLAVTMTLADGNDAADAIPPQGSRGWMPGYIRE
ncbi:MAG: hypothetical protein WEA31_02500 [Pirellulales bacterium]